MSKDLMAEFRQSSRRWHKTFESFMQCMGWAEKGKTFIYYHPDFVAIDMKTWKKIDKKLNPPKITFHGAKKLEMLDIYDEYDQWTPEMQKRLDKIVKPCLTNQLNKSKGE